MQMTSVNDYNNLGALTELRHKAGSDPDQALTEVAQQFESLFINMVLKSMRDTIPEDSLFGGNTMDSYMNMFDQQLAVDLSAKGGIGLADIIERQLSVSAALTRE